MAPGRLDRGSPARLGLADQLCFAAAPGPAGCAGGPTALSGARHRVTPRAMPRQRCGFGPPGGRKHRLDTQLHQPTLGAVITKRLNCCQAPSGDPRISSAPAEAGPRQIIGRRSSGRGEPARQADQRGGQQREGDEQLGRRARSPSTVAPARLGGGAAPASRPPAAAADRGRICPSTIHTSSPSTPCPALRPVEQASLRVSAGARGSSRLDHDRACLSVALGTALPQPVL